MATAAFSSAITGACSKDKRAAWAQGLQESVKELAKRLGPNKTTISNYPTNEALKLCTGGMMERGGSIEAVISWADKRCGLWDQPCLLDYHAQYADRDIGTFNNSVANFLIGIYKYAYFGVGGGWGGDGPHACASWLRRYPEYEKPLGEPKGAATITNSTWGNVYTREFASGTTVYVGQYLDLTAIGKPATPRTTAAASSGRTATSQATPVGALRQRSRRRRRPAS